MRKQNTTSLYDPLLEHSACGVGFLTRKDSKQTHELLEKGHEALCAVPHRGGMSAEGVGDGAGVSVDLSLRFFSKLTGHDLKAGAFGVGNFFLPDDARVPSNGSFRSVNGFLRPKTAPRARRWIS